MFFESVHSVRSNEFSLWTAKNFSFPLHIHRSFEFFCQQEGESEINIDGKTHVLRGGQAVLIFPFQPHSYSFVSEGKHTICIFSPDIVNLFYRSVEKRLPTDNLFEFNLGADIKTDTIFLQKAIAYSICGEFSKAREYRDFATGINSEALIALLVFAEKNHSSHCLLRDAAAHVGYDYAYLSKLFKKKVGIPFNSYINLLRINDAKNLLSTSRMSISEIKDTCGFRCMRTFNREFFSITGLTPSEYRRSAHSPRSQ